MFTFVHCFSAVEQRLVGMRKFHSLSRSVRIRKFWSRLTQYGRGLQAPTSGIRFGELPFESLRTQLTRGFDYESIRII